jgi:hypothetical protein
MLLRKRGWLGIRVAIRHSAQTGSFSKGFEFTYQRSVSSMEKEWRQGLMGRWQWLPLLTGSGLVWGIAVVLFIVAYLAVRRRGKRRLAQMAIEENLIDQAIEPPRLKQLPAGSALPQKIGKTKIRIDDDIHTLH